MKYKKTKLETQNLKLKLENREPEHYLPGEPRELFPKTS